MKKNVVKMVVKYSRIAAVAIIFLASVSCNNKNSKSKPNVLEVEDTDSAIVVKGAYNVSKILTWNNSLVLITQQEPLFRVFSLDSCRQDFAFGYKGKAADELLSVPHGVTIRNDQALFYDFPEHSLVRALLNGPSVIKEPMPYTADFRPVTMAEIDGTIIALGGIAEGRLATIDMEHGKIIPAFDYPFPVEGVEGINRGITLQSEVCVAPSTPRFVVRTLVSDCFEIYSLEKGVLSREFVNDYHHVPSICGRNIDFKNSKAGYIRCYTNDDYIFMMKSEDCYNDASAKGLISDTIDVFRWNGEKVKTICLPVPIGAFCVYKEYLYGVIEENNQTKIKRFQLN